MKIDGELEQNKAYLKKLNRDLRNRINLKEKELQKVKEFYDIKKGEVQEEGKDKVLLQKMQLDERMMRNTERTQARLEEIKHKTELQKQQIDEHLNTFKKRNQELLNIEKADLDQKMLDDKLKFEELSSEVAHRNQLDIQKIKNDTDLAISTESDEARHRLNTLTKDNEFKINTSRSQFENTIEQRELEQMRRKTDQRRFHTSEMMKLTNKHMIDQEKLKTRNSSQLFKQEENQKLLLKQKLKAFEDKYNSLTKQHEATLKLVQEKNIREIEDLKRAHSTKKQFIENRSSDKFYSTSQLSPTVEDTPNNYIVKIKVPEHEKENVSLNGNQRSMTVSLTRRYSDDVTDEETGTRSKTSKSESFIQEIKVPDIINPRKILSKYENDTLTFIVPKM